jgi:hypothetical protein
MEEVSPVARGRVTTKPSPFYLEMNTSLWEKARWSRELPGKIIIIILLRRREG